MTTSINIVDIYPIATKIVRSSVTTTISLGVTSQITVRLIAMEALTPNAAQYIQTNNLTSEIISRAGLREDTIISSYTQTQDRIVGGE